MRNYKLSVIAVLAAFVFVGSLRADNGPEELAGGATAAELRNLAHQLDADRFVDREIAVKKLIQAGAAAVEPVRGAAQGGSLELATRSIFVLKELGLSNNPETELAARDALRALTNDGNPTVQRLAKNTLDQLSTLLVTRVIAQIQQLGGKVETSHEWTQTYRVLPMISRIEIGANWTGGEEGLVHLRRLAGLDELLLTGDQVNDRWLERISEIDRISNLEIKRGNISDAGLVHLKKLKGLAQLHIWYCPITDDGVESLAGLKNVQMISIYGTKMSVASAGQLEKSLPGANIDVRRGAFLGVRGHPDEEVCRITSVEPQSAAEKAGIEPEDIVISYDGKPVTSIDDLTKSIGQNVVGDRVTVEIQRGDETLELNVVLGEWE